MSDILLKLDESNEIVFEVNISSTEAISSIPEIRFICENEKQIYTFRGKFTNENEVIVSIPALQNIISEGRYKSKLEVIINDRYFVPLKNLSTEFKKTAKVVAEIKQSPSIENQSSVKAKIKSTSLKTKYQKGLL